MKILGLVLLSAVASASWLPEYIGDDPATSNAEKQLHVLHLLYRVTEPIDPKFHFLAHQSQHFIPPKHPHEYFDKGESANKLISEIEEGNMLERKHWFSLFNDRHREEAIMLFETLELSRTYITFISTAAYFRERMNEGEFVYAFSTAVLHSKFCKDLVLPPLYEITPHMFTDAKVIHKAYFAKMIKEPGHFQLNFTESISNTEQRVAYFRDDIGMNLHHVSWHMDFPFWWNDIKYAHSFDRKGELFFWAHHQLTVRYDAERISNYMIPVEEWNWDEPIAEGFVPRLEYRFDEEFPTRADNTIIKGVDGIVSVTDVKDYEHRISDAITSGYAINNKHEFIDIKNVRGINILGNIVEASTNSINPDFYGSLHNLGHIILGEQGDPLGKYNLLPGVTEHFETSMRDPAFFLLHKYLDRMFKKHKDSLPPYTKEDIQFSEVSVDNVEFSRSLETFFEDFEYNMKMAVNDLKAHSEVPLSAHVKRLNHKPFSLNFNVINNQQGDVYSTFRVFLCPKEDKHGVISDFNKERWGCIEFDKFWRILSPGKNEVHRKSVDASTTTPDSLSYKKLVAIAEKANRTGQALPKLERSCGIPNRFLLPRGKHYGMKFHLFVAVTDGRKDAVSEGLDKHIHRNHAHCGYQGDKYPDLRPLGFPLDRSIPDESVLLDLPNVYRSDVKIRFDEYYKP